MSEEEEEELSVLQQFKQQRMPAWQPIPTLAKTIILFLIMGGIFLGIGIPMLILSNKLVQVKMQYDKLCLEREVGCSLVMEVTQEMVGPVFVYYQLDNYFQNHRLYAKSISLEQLWGQTVSVSDLQTSCSPVVYNKDLYVNVSLAGSLLDPNGYAYPCGMVAYTIFNDTFALTKAATPISIASTGIAWPSDIANFKLGNLSQMWLNLTDERTMNWMRLAALPNFRKLWGRIDSGLSVGNYTLFINNYFTVSEFSVSKSFVLSTANFFGTKNDFLSYLYIGAGSFCLLVAIIFWARRIRKSKEL